MISGQYFSVGAVYMANHFIEAFSVGRRGIKYIKWPVQVKMTFFRGFTWTGHFIEMKICLERGPQGDEGPGCAARARAPKGSQN